MELPTVIRPGEVQEEPVDRESEIRSRYSRTKPRIGVALSGGFARGIAHIGVLRMLQRHHIPITMIAGVSAGSIAAAAWASGMSPDEIENVASKLSRKHVLRWSLSRQGFASSDCMNDFIKQMFKIRTFEEMQIPLGIIATDLQTGEPVIFSGEGDITLPIRASCAYPGLFQPIYYQNRCLVDGVVSMDVPARPLREMGATHVISVALPTARNTDTPQHILSIVNRCMQILQDRNEQGWRNHSDVVIRPEINDLGWDAFDRAATLIEAGEQAALAVLPTIQSWLDGSGVQLPVDVASTTASLAA